MKTPMNTFTGARLDPIWPGDGRTIAAAFAANLTIKGGTVIGQISATAASEVQSLSISGTPTGGTITLAFGGQTTSPLGYNATAAQVQAALEALTPIGAGNIAASGGALPGSAVTLTFQADLANQPQPLIAVTAALTGGTSPAASVSRTTAGVANGKWAPYASAHSDGTQTARALVAMDVATDPAGRITFGTLSTGGEHGEKYPSAPIYYKGEFKTADLTGLDSNALSGFGRLITGSLSDGVLSLL
ncbi:MAG: hypothetical protein HYR64_03690 [Fimbriimonas ginsengisoli]|uniref:Uncharacterized protein n=1 Tax=Fimbriimonas ginsengisoli TaxID=1005039 RepID=A0A931LZP4_FIMGI|nr:hypothetical protein [Fimbriimonas ginsengisoli]